MLYRRIGQSGLKVSILSFGSWVSFGPQLDVKLAQECMSAAWDRGVNFFDNAEAYAQGESETIMGKVFSQLAWPREKFVVSSKYYWGISGGVNMSHTLNRKYLIQAVDRSLERFGLDFLDIIYCHRADPNTPIEETVWAMSDIISAGKALYWGTSEWSTEEVTTACEIANRKGLRAPIVEQPQYNLLWRHRVEKEYLPLYQDYGIGLTTWSPLASGLLTGKYVNGNPGDSRASLHGYEWLADMLLDESRNSQVGKFIPISRELGCSPAQLAIAWCCLNENVSSVITGASRPEQVEENLKAIDVISKIDSDMKHRIESIFIQ